MEPGTELTTVDQVRDEGSYLFTATNSFDMDEEIVVVPCEDADAGVDADAGEDGHPDGDGSAVTATNSFDMDEEIIVVPCEDADASVDADAGEDGHPDGDGSAVTAWINRCTHEAQRLDTGRGVAMRDDQIICPKHGSMFDACSGECDNGEAAGTTLPDVDVAVEDGTVYLVDDEYEFEHEGGVDDSDGPSSTSHIGF